jgi:Flp pilus assembly protein TadG
MKRPPKIAARKGVLIPLTAFLIVVILGMCAFSVDVGYMVVVQSELQNAADAAALAGAEQLQPLFVQYYSPGQTNQAGILTQATTNIAPSGTNPGSPMYAAEQFALFNMAGGVYVSVPDSDVSFGYTDANGNFTTEYTGFPNTVSVTTRRDETANGSLPLFFGPVLNKASQNLEATSRATIYAGDISSLQAVPNVQMVPGWQSHIMPVALDVHVWTTFINGGKVVTNNGSSLSTTTYPIGTSPDGNIYLGPNGLPQLQVYPFDTNTPGSFGLVDVGLPQNNVPAFRTWIDDGQTPNDIQYLLTNGLLPVSPSAPQPWKVGPGLKSTLLTDFQAQIGLPNAIPLFIPNQSPANTPGNTSYVAGSGNGQNATYAIIGFVGVTISSADGHGNSNMNISIQPMALIDVTTVINNATPAGTALSSFATSPTTFISAKLTY